MINVFQFKMILQHWNKLLTTECKAIRIPWPTKVTASGTQLTDDGFVIYPIFKNGRTSLYHYGLEKQAETFTKKQKYPWDVWGLLWCDLGTNIEAIDSKVSHISKPEKRK